MDYYERRGRNAALTCPVLRHQPADVLPLAEAVQPQAPAESRGALTPAPPSAPAHLGAGAGRGGAGAAGKDRLAVLLRDAGWSVSTSMAGRILTQLRRRGVLREPPAARVAARKPRPPRPYAVRKPKTYLAKRPGDIVQVDTLDLRPLSGIIL